MLDLREIGLQSCQGGNALNKSMQGLWTTQRKAKVNLNSPVPSVPASPPSTPKPSSVSQNVTPCIASSSQVTIEDSNEPTLDSKPISSGVKRKLRSSRSTTGDESSKRTKAISSKSYDPPSARLSDLGGVDSCVEKMLELVAMPLCHPEIYLHTGVQPTRGVLLHGPPGCGKTLLANAIAGVSNFCLMRCVLHSQCSSGTWCSLYQRLCPLNRFWHVW